MKSFFAWMFLLLLQSAVFAQSATQLTSNAGHKTEDQKKIDHLNDIFVKLYLEAPDSARGIAEKALLLSEKAQYQVGIGQSFLNIGHVYWSQSYYPIALFYVNKGLMTLPKDQTLLISTGYYIQGRIYSDLHNYKDALKSLALSEQYAHGNPGALAQVYSERALVYKRQGRYNEAIDNANRSLVLNRSIKDTADAAIIYGRLSGIYRAEFQDKAALAYADTALKMSFATRNKRLRANTYVEFAGIYLHLRDYKKAIVYANLGGSLADSIGVVDAITSAYKALISGYEGLTQLKYAIAYQRRYAKMQDSLNNFNKAKNAELIKDYFTLNARLNDMAVAERNTAAIKEKVKWQKMIIISLALSLVITVIMLSVTYYFYKQKKLISEQLNLQNEALTDQKEVISAQAVNLEKLSKVKDKLLAVIGHDLRTPIANLRNIADMFEADFLTKEEVHWLMKDINPTVKSVELTLSNLLEWAGSHIKGHSVNTSQLDIFLMGVEMEQVFNPALQKKSIEFINHANPGKSVMADENHIKVVLRNLISNAIKFTDLNGKITLHSEMGENHVLISITDNGKGMTRDEIGKLFSAQTHFSQRGTSGESGTGIGLLLCKELVELNGGKLWTISQPGKGSTFYFTLPLNAEYA